jgi:dTDP-4-amino-4,6-dideoxygalactose transaminase
MVIDSEVSGVNRERVREQLAGADIESRPAWKPMHLQPAFEGATVVGGSTSERIFRDALCLPSGSGLSDHDLDRVIGEIHNAFGSFANS